MKGFYRILSNTDLTLKINNQDYYQGSTIPLKAGGNVAVMKVNQAGKASIEFIVKDKYKQEHKDTLRFSSLLPIKPIQASLDKSSVSVKVNQDAGFKLTLAEQNYNGLFDVQLDIISGSGEFEAGNKLLFSEGTHTINFTPKAQGNHTFKITVKDGNNQEKILNATVQATISPLNASLSSTTLNLAQGEKGQVILTTSEADYTGNLNASYTVDGVAQKFEFGSINLGVGGTATFQQGTTPITITSSSIGTSVYTLHIEDVYKQTKDLTIKVITKGKVTATAGAGGTVSGGGNFELNQSCTVKATPNTGFTFIGWFNGSTKVSDNATYTFNVINSVNLEAKFSANAYTVSATAEEGGTASGSGQYEHGKTATLKATVNDGYTFAGWYEGTTRVSTALEYTITVTSNKTFIAKFTPNSYNVTVNAQTGGSVTGGGSYKHNTTATVTATVNTGYVFGGWYNGNTKVSDALKYTFTVTGAVTLEARFTANKYNLVVNAQAGGSATGSGSFSHNSNVTVTATPSSGYAFAGWYKDNAKVSDVLQYTFTITENTTLEARFSINKFTIIVNALEGGSATGGGSYNYGTNLTIKATVNAGYTFAGWYKGNSKVSDALSYTFSVSEAATYEARFTINKYNIIVNTAGGGTVSGAGIYAYNSNVTVKATPSANYTFVGWYEGTTQVSNSASYTFKVLKETTLEAKFVVNKYTITLSGVNGTQTGGGSFEYGTNATVKATPSANYTFIGWYEGSTQISTSNPYTFKVEKDRIIEAKYQIAKRVLTLSSPTGGTSSGAGSFDHGSNVTVKATANTGYTFEGWYNGSTKVSSNANYTFTITSNTALTAKFTLNNFKITVTAGLGGTATGGGTFPYNSQIVLTATAKTGYMIEGWYNGNTKVSSLLNYTHLVKEDKSYEARFKVSDEQTKFNGSMIWAGHGGFGVAVEGYHPVYMKKNSTTRITMNVTSGRFGRTNTHILEGTGTVNIENSNIIVVTPTSTGIFKVRLNSDTQTNPNVTIVLNVVD
jgi:uncharacterized repeat protein (TIGR02543 family)